MDAAALRACVVAAGPALDAAAVAAVAAACVAPRVEACIARGLTSGLDAASAAEMCSAQDPEMCASDVANATYRRAEAWLLRTLSVLSTTSVVLDSVMVVLFPWVFLWWFSGTILAFASFIRFQWELGCIALDVVGLTLLNCAAVLKACGHAAATAAYACVSRDFKQVHLLEARQASAREFRAFVEAEEQLLKARSQLPEACLACAKRPAAEDDDPDSLDRHLRKLKLVLHRLATALRPGDVRDVTSLIAELTPLIVRNPIGLETVDLRHVEQYRVHTQGFEPQVAACIRQAAELLTGPTAKASARHEFLQWCRARQQALGATCLCLSGGGSLAMYHMGLCRFLLEEDLMPSVVTSVSGGAIVAAFLAIFPREELLEEWFVEDVSTRYKERWFPPLATQLASFLSTGYLVETESFDATTKRYFQDWTFLEAFERTGRHVSIAITSTFSGRLPGPVMLNHLTSPHITIASAVATSCTAPGIMAPRGLVQKDPTTCSLKPFDLLGSKFTDGSLTAELPKDQLRTCFNVSQFLVSQVNPHVVPFLTKGNGALERTTSALGQNLQRHVRYLSKYKVLPMFFGKNIGIASHLGQNFGLQASDTLTLHPELGMLDIKDATANPSVADMRKYLLEGQRYGWRCHSQVNGLLLVELALGRAVQALRRQLEEPPRGAKASQASQSQAARRRTAC